MTSRGTTRVHNCCTFAWAEGEVPQHRSVRVLPMHHTRCMVELRKQWMAQGISMTEVIKPEDPTEIGLRRVRWL